MWLLKYGGNFGLAVGEEGGFMEYGEREEGEGEGGKREKRVGKDGD